MKYAIIGTGAIGGYYGAKLAYSGQDVHFLLHSDYQFVREHGLRVQSCDGSFHLPHVNVYQRTADMPQVDVVIVGLKTTNNHLLAEMLPPLLHENTIVVLIQNGVGVEQDVEQTFPGIQLVAGLAFICSAKTEPGVVNHQCYGQINFGNYSCRDAQMFNNLVEEFCSAGIKAGVVDYTEARWRKAVWNMPFNGMTVALNTQTDCLLKNPSTRVLIRDLMMEVISVPKALGINAIGEDFVDKMIQMTDEMTPYSPSMKLDFDFHRPMEIQYLYTRPIEIAHKAGVRLPKLEMLEAELRFIDSQR
ncbi:putative 2-dehydropantoate 2-reductase [Xylanibacter brevis]|uniref:putative 2-dehydropantoate 2-reductase n=1 Tax=Xylanibacter brevis TaxID=83231 RepID=UPI000487B6CB|nr:putative 2-dehydropantoate 2-reductase [Xylanibacter brevis]